jgi:hypothetical protein
MRKGGVIGKALCWSRGMMFACHANDPGSSPGRSTLNFCPRAVFLPSAAASASVCLCRLFLFSPPCRFFCP